ncbi:formin-like protein 14 [Helianthus annuus]|uniref:formin-like protein 14 n=1 Tax=Helianthus annuus TaxID=4232 RepID=UPI000B900ADA|nr:formin-like protein 14 [Helianthus annuus]
MPPSGSHIHPIEISSGFASYAGSSYQGPNEWDQYWNQFTLENTPSYHSPILPPLPPQEDVQMEPVEQPQPPPEPLRRKRGARMSVRLGPRSSSLPPLPPTYPPIPEDPQMGGPSNTAPKVDPTLVTFSQPPPPSGFDNPIPTYPDTSRYNPFNPSTPVDYNYQAPSYDPYMQTVVHNALYLSPFLPAYPATGYPNYGYQYPVVPQPQPQLEAINQVLE